MVDTGLHAKHWTRQQAIDYGIEASEVERYVVVPGQACSYMLGALKLIELRDGARQALGDRFSFKDYHELSAMSVQRRDELVEVWRQIHRTASAGIQPPRCVPRAGGTARSSAPDAGVALHRKTSRVAPVPA